MAETFINETRRGEYSPLADHNEVSKRSEQVKTGFRIKKAAKIALISLAATFAAITLAAGVTALITAFTVTTVLPVIIAGSIATVGAAALAILGFIKAWEKLTPHLPEGLRKQANNIQSIVCALASSTALGFMWPINYTKKNIKPQDVDPSKPLIIGLHGFMGSGNNWMYHFGRLREAGYKNLASINFGNIFKFIDDGNEKNPDNYVNKLRKLVLEYKKGVKLPEGQKLQIQFLCHSMGGLVARHYNQKFSEIDGVEINDIITLGTPLNGTPVAKLACGLSGAAAQMIHGSKFVKKQQKVASVDRYTKHYNIASKCDFVVGNRSAKSGKARYTKVDELDATGHVSFLFSDKAGDLIVDYLNRTEPHSLV